MNVDRLMCAIDLRSLAPEAVERSAPGAAPTAFRIWRAGDNMTDKGLTVFSEKSARELIADQKLRQNLFSIDVDHLSLSGTAPPESRKAVGWHKLEVRRDAQGRAEMWAVDAEWTDVARSGLEKDPPEWRYFSPAYDVSKKTREVTAYLNTALTNNPATWAVTALATSTAEERVMTKKEMIAALEHMATGESPESKVCGAVLAMMKSGEIPKDGDGDGGEKKDPPPAKDSEGGADDAEKKKTEEAARAAADKDEKDRVAAARAIEANKDPAIVLAARVQALEAKIAKDEDDKERERLFASRPDFAPEVKKALEGKPLETLRFAVDTFPRGTAKTGGIATVTATRGAGEGTADGRDRTPRLPPEEKTALDRAMGIAPRDPAIKRVANRVSFGVMTHEEATRTLAGNGGSK